MSEPILIHIKGHTYSNCLPIDFAADDVKAWVQAFDHVVRYVAPHRLSFILHGRGNRVLFRKGIPVKKDVDRLCNKLQMFQNRPEPIQSILPAAA